MKTVVLLFWIVLLFTGATRVVQTQEPNNTSLDDSKVATVSQNSKDAEMVDEYRIRLGDALDVVVERRPELNWRGRVNSEGNISALPFIKDAIHVLCHTELKVADDIAAAYAPLIKNPTITVRVIERSTEPAILLGAVRTAQRFQMQRDVRLVELLFISGGVTDRASGDIQVFSPMPSTCRESQPDNEQGKKDPENPLKIIKILDVMAGVSGANPIIRPGDIVTVMAAEPVYVTGGVVSPQAINFREQLTLSRAIATVGGLTSNARGSEIRIYRRKANVTEQDVIKADYNAIRKQKQPDIPLRAYDIVEVSQGSGGPSGHTWLSAAQDIIMEGSKSDSLPLRVIK